MRKIISTLICLLCAALCIAQEVDKEQLEELKLQMEAHISKDVPEDIIDKIAGAKCSAGSGAMIPDEGNSYTNYGISVYSNWRETPTSVVILDEIVRDGAVRRNILLDYLIFTKQDLTALKSQFPNSRISFCMAFVFGYPDEYIYAIGYFDTTDQEYSEHYTKALKVWGVRKSDMKFVEIPTDGIYAINEGAGV